MNKIVAKALDFRIVTLAVAGALALAAGHADARPAHQACTALPTSPSTAASCSAAVAPTAPWT